MYLKLIIQSPSLFLLSPSLSLSFISTHHQWGVDRLNESRFIRIYIYTLQIHMDIYILVHYRGTENVYIYTLCMYMHYIERCCYLLIPLFMFVFLYTYMQVSLGVWLPSLSPDHWWRALPTPRPRQTLRSLTRAWEDGNNLKDSPPSVYIAYLHWQNISSCTVCVWQ